MKKKHVTWFFGSRAGGEEEGRRLLLSYTKVHIISPKHLTSLILKAKLPTQVLIILDEWFEANS